MRTVTVPVPAIPFVLQGPLITGLDATYASGFALPALSPDSSAEAETPLLVAALEDLEARRAAIEWLLNANLLRLVLA
jgi:hypothetical protein